MEKNKVLIFTDAKKNNFTSRKYDLLFIKEDYPSYESYLLKNSFPKYIVYYNQITPLNFRTIFTKIPYDVVVVNGKDIYDIDKLLKDDVLLDDYNIFSGKKITSINKKNVEEIKRVMKDFLNISIQMIKAGYLKEENIDKIEDWIITFQEPILQLFVEYFKPETSNDSVTIEDEFLENPKFRKNILEVMLKVLANYLVNNDLFDTNKIRGKSWLDEDVWLNII